MIFNKNQKDFPADANKFIWDAGIHIMPLQTTLPQEVRTQLPQYMVNSCEQLQKFFLHMLSDLYENPEAYEPFPFGRLGIQSKYIMPFADFGIVGQAGKDYLSINRSVFDKLFLKQIKSKAYHRNAKVTISAEQRIKTLERIGLKIDYRGNDAILTNELYPNMFYAMCEMAQIALREKGSGDNSFTYCDFRQLCKEYKYDKYENALIFLNDEDKDIAKQLDSAAKKFKLSRSIKSGHCPGYGVTYKYKKNEIMTVNGLNGDLRISIHFLYDAKNTTPIYRLFDEIESDLEDLKIFVYRQLLRCCRCYEGCAGYADMGWPMQIYGKTNRMCVYTDRMGIHMPIKAGSGPVAHMGKHFATFDDIPLIEKTLFYAKNLMDEMM